MCKLLHAFSTYFIVCGHQLGTPCHFLANPVFGVPTLGSSPLTGDPHSLDTVDHTVPTALSQDAHAVIFKSRLIESSPLDLSHDNTSPGD